MDLRSYLISRGITPKGETGEIQSTEIVESDPFSEPLKPAGNFQFKRFVSWDITEIEIFMKNETIDSVPFKLSGCLTITDPVKFTDSHYATIIAHNGNETYKPYYERLLAFIRKRHTT